MAHAKRGFDNDWYNGLHRATHAVIIQAVVARFDNRLTTRAGATVQLIFMQYFQDMAHSHFSVRRLERQYGVDLIPANYENIARVL